MPGQQAQARASEALAVLDATARASAVVSFPTPRARSSGAATAREKKGFNTSCGYNYLRERQQELLQARVVPPQHHVLLKDRHDALQRVRPLPSPRALCGELCLTKGLPSSIIKGASGKAPSPLESASHPYQWTPVHVRPSGEPAGSAYTLAMHGTGTYVNTLTLDVRKETFEGSTSRLLRLDTHFAPEGKQPWCYLLDGSSPFVILRGVVVRIDPGGWLQRPLRSAEPLAVGRLPTEARPSELLRFAALARQRDDRGGTVSSRLVTLSVQPEGWILLEPGPGGRDEVLVGSSIDLSAVRFSIGRGISLIDDVCLHICDIAGTRLACLQGSLEERSYTIHGRKPLALLPESCVPVRDTHFVVSGTCGGFHLVTAKPTNSGAGGSGEVYWKDGKWTRDFMCLNGMMYEVAPFALALPNPLAERVVNESTAIAILDFQRYLFRRFGTIERAWEEAFDTDGSGSVNFTEFGLGCKASGFVGNSSRLWTALDEDLSGSISVEELGMDADELLAQVRAAAREQEGGVKTYALLSTQKPKRTTSVMGSFTNPADAYK